MNFLTLHICHGLVESIQKQEMNLTNVPHGDLDMPAE